MSSKCSSSDEKILCKELEKALGQPINESNVKKAYKKFALQNHPDKFNVGLSSLEKKNKITNFKKISGLFNDCSDATKNRSYSLCQKEGVNSKKRSNPRTSYRSPSSSSSSSPQIPKTRKKRTSKSKKVNAECIRKTSNWSTIKQYHRFENEKFDKVKLLEDLEKCSPKLQALLENIKQIDERDLKKDKKVYKHVIYSDVKKMGHGVKIIASALESSGFEKCFKLNQLEKIVIEKSKKKSNGFGLMVSTPLFGKNYLVKNKKETLRLYNERPDNIYGDNMRIILIDNGFKEGIDLFDVKYMHIFEPQTTKADFRQALGRATRFCGQKGLKFIPNVGWKMDVFTYHLTHKLNDAKSIDLHDVFMENSDINLANIKITEEIEKVAIESAIDYDLNYNVNKFSFEGESQKNNKKDKTSQKGGSNQKFIKIAREIDCKTDKFDKVNARATSNLPFSLSSMELIYNTFDQKDIVELPRGYKTLKSLEKRKFFALLLKTNRKYCERLVSFIKESRFSRLYSKISYSKKEMKTVKDYYNSKNNSPGSIRNNTLALVKIPTPNKSPNDSLALVKIPTPKKSDALMILNSPSSDSSKNSPQQMRQVLSNDTFKERRNESFEDFRKRINKEFSQFKYEKLKVENLCDVPGQNSSRIVEFTPSQNFISHYFVPKQQEKGLLVWHSVGTGKTCTAIATKSRTWEKQGYTILWVTRTTLRNDIWKNMFDKVCDYIIRDKLSRGEKIPKDLKNMGEIRKHLGIKFLNPVSFKQFSNAASKMIDKDELKGKKNLFETLINLNGSKDPLNKTLIIIDEAHKLLSKDLIGPEKPNFPDIRKVIYDSYAVSGKDSCRLLLMTATPFMDDPLDFMKIFNLIIGDPNKRIPTNMEDFKQKYKMTDNLEFTKESISKLQKTFQGKISFLDRRFDPRNFVQPVFHKVASKMSVADSTMEELVEKCKIEFEEYMDVCNKTRDDNIKIKKKEEEEKYEALLEELLESEKELDKSYKKLEKMYNQENEAKIKAVGKAPKGTKQKVGKEFSEKIEKLKKEISLVKNQIKKLKQSFNDSKKTHVKVMNKIEKDEVKQFKVCEKNAIKENKKCLKDAKKSVTQNSPLYQSQVFEKKCNLNIKEL